MLTVAMALGLREEPQRANTVSKCNCHSNQSILFILARSPSVHVKVDTITISNLFFRCNFLVA